MRKTITGAEQSAYLAGFRMSAWRFERQHAYTIDQEDRQLQSFLAGRPIPPSEDVEHPELGEWMNRVAAHVAAGRSIGRVRIVDEPPTDYQRWLHWLDTYNRQAGEEISYLGRAAACEAGLLTAETGPDWWLLDDERLILIHFDKEGRRTSAELVEGAPEVAEAREFRAKVIRAAEEHQGRTGQTSFPHLGGKPSVVLISQLGCGADIWKPVLEHLAGLDVVTYDRPGTGDAPPRAASNWPLPYSVFADELSRELDATEVSGPVILVGHSFGALIARMFADRYKRRVAGLVIVDGSIPPMHLEPETRRIIDGDGPDATEVDTVAGHAEIVAARLPHVPALVLTRTPGRWDGENPPPRPAVEDLWLASQRLLARELGCPLLVADNSGHQLQREAPDLVAYAIRTVYQAVTDRALPNVDPELLAAVGASLDGHR